MATKNLLIEIGVCELPTAAVEVLSDSFLTQFEQKLIESKITYSSAKRFATARRLAVQFTDVLVVQPEQQVERRGPALATAKDASGNYTKATIGFAQSCGVTPNELTVVETDKGAWLYYQGSKPGQETSKLVADWLPEIMAGLPIAKRMRWGNRDDSFVRPVLSLVALFDSEVIDTSLFGVISGRKTIGHRYHGEKFISISDAMSYEQVLADSYVIADIDKRREFIIEQATLLADNILDSSGNHAKASAVIEDDILNEVNALVEYPVSILGAFDSRYLSVPQEVLIKTMQDNQKYFAVVDENGKLLPYFITMANIASTNPDVVRIGNQRVIEPRFADAEFFWKNDLKKTLSSRQEQLKKVVYQDKLGSIYDRSERIASIAKWVAGRLELNAENAGRAAMLAKCDLVSEMVFEFGELQGVMGKYYAENDGEALDVCSAMIEQYLPKFSGDNLPQTDTGLCVALADKIENIVGGFAVGAKPTGTKDPYALRRASLGVIRLLNDTKLDLDLEALINYTSTTFGSKVNTIANLDEIRTYINERLKGYYAEQGITYDVFDAVVAVNPHKISDFSLRVSALSEFKSNPVADSLFAANKRISNILKKNTSENELAEIKTALLKEQAEKDLFQQKENVKDIVAKAIKKQNYQKALAELAVLGKPLDNFFDSVMVMSDDAELKNNRIALLSNIFQMFLQVADVSQIQS